MVKVTRTLAPKPAEEVKGNLSHEPSNAPRSGFAADQLLSFVERYERLQEERDGLGDDQKEVMAEAKGTGFDTKILRQVIRRRKMNSADRMEQDSVLELYEEGIRTAEKALKNASLAAGT